MFALEIYEGQYSFWFLHSQTTSLRNLLEQNQSLDQLHFHVGPARHLQHVGQTAEIQKIELHRFIPVEIIDNLTVHEKDQF
jgi:hypothetical protein